MMEQASPVSSPDHSAAITPRRAAGNLRRAHVPPLHLNGYER
jgi:hypothetical protein